MVVVSLDYFLQPSKVTPSLEKQLWKSQLWKSISPVPGRISRQTQLQENPRSLKNQRKKRFYVQNVNRDLQIPSNLSKLLTFFNSAICVRVDSQQFPKWQRAHVHIHSWRGGRAYMRSGPLRTSCVARVSAFVTWQAGAHVLRATTWQNCHQFDLTNA